MNKNYQNLVFTHHALGRLQLRNISQDKVRQVLSHPDKTYPSQKPEQIKFIRTLQHRTIHVIAKHLPEQKKWLIISVWVRGEDDPVPFMWRLISWPFIITWKIIAKIARIILSYIKKYLLERK